MRNSEFVIKGLRRNYKIKPISLCRGRRLGVPLLVSLYTRFGLPWSSAPTNFSSYFNSISSRQIIICRITKQKRTTDLVVLLLLRIFNYSSSPSQQSHSQSKSKSNSSVSPHEGHSALPSRMISSSK